MVFLAFANLMNYFTNCKSNKSSNNYISPKVAIASFNKSDIFLSVSLYIVDHKQISENAFQFPLTILSTTFFGLARRPACSLKMDSSF